MRDMKYLAVGLFVSVLIACGLSGGYVWWLMTPISPTATESVSFVIAKGDSFAEVAQKLQSKNLIRSAMMLRLLAKVEEKNVVVHPGTYKIAQSMTIDEVLSVLLAEPDDVWVTLLEGWRTEEMTRELKTKLSATFDEDEFIALAKGKEGTLFPDTYLLPKEVTAQTIITTMENTFKKRYSEVLQEVGKTDRLQDEIIVIASLLEREASDPVEMKTVAGVFENRLQLGMPLQVDATLQYAKGYNKTLDTWWAEPSSTDKQVVSPFNTYMHKGLPPGPICNPGKAALIAAARPDRTDYLFYISDKTGQMHYARTLEEHNANIAKYLR